MILPLLIGGAALLALASSKKKGASSSTPTAAEDSNSAREDAQPDSMGLPIDPMYAPYVPETLVTWRYYYGGPKPWPVVGLKRGVNLSGVMGDCGGSAEVLDIEAGVLPEDSPRYLSGDYWSGAGGKFVKVAVDDILPGDFLCYNGHVAKCVGGRGKTCTVWSNSGGHKTTFGNDDNARPKLFLGPYYRKDFYGAVRRVK